MSNTIPRPSQSPLAIANPPGPLLSLQSPPEPLRYPALPCPPRHRRFATSYTVTTHLIPAAFPRSSPFVPLPAFPAQENKDERTARIQRFTGELLSLQARHAPDQSGTQQTVLWSVLNRYVRKSTSIGGTRGSTLLLLHANGLHKETFEPTIHHLIQAADDDAQYQIDEIWALDAVQHGDSALINAQDLGALFIWNDHARDILNFILYFIPETLTSSALPTYLARVPPEISSARENRGFSDRELVVVGHSFSGCAATLAAHTTPAPFSGLVLIDPVISPSSFPRDEPTRQLVVGALARRGVWSSREEAYSLMRRSPFFGTWDPDVLRNYVEYALVEDTSGKVRLKCSNIQEAVVFADKTRGVEAWSILPQIDKRIAMKWIIPSYEKSILRSYELVQEGVWRRPENVTNTQVMTAAHLVWAAPHSINLVRRDGSTNASKIAAPIIASLVFLVAFPIIFYRKGLLSKLRRISLPSFPVRQRPSPTNVRDLTAEEIAGTAATNQAQAASAARSNRRTGRNRRTPSQISTRSLPAYMKEPGELELVIIQGSQDMEDAPLTAQVVMPSVREDEDESANSHSRGTSQASYVIVNDDPLAQTPLLERNDSNENENTHERQNSHTSAASVDISDARHTDQLSPLPNTAEMPDPRGEAPPYFEVVGDLGDIEATSGDLARVDTADTLPIAPDTFPESDDTSQHPVRRRSMFRGLIHAASRALSSPHPASPTLSLSRPSRDMAVSPPPRPSNLSSRQGGARSPLSGHRASPSHSESVQSITSSAFGRVVTRTHSRSVTNVAGGLTSPSTISIASISSPLTHTAIRTDFVYPRTGPTPEQLKLISSVESVSKFGVPYGPDAVAFASASLVNLHGPPPEFEERPSTDGLPGPSVGETRARAASALSRLSRDGNPPDSRISLSSPPSSLRESIVPSESAAHGSESSSTHPNPETGRSPVPDHDNDNPSAPKPEYFEDEKKEPKEDNTIRTVPPRIPSPSPTVGTTSTAVTVTKATAAELGVVPEFPEGVASSGHRPALPSFATETAAPSSFRMPSTPHGRIHPSRSSSMETFRTAGSIPEHPGSGSDRGASDTEHETDAFMDAESGAETEVESRPATPHVVHVESTVVFPEPPALSA